MNVSLATVRHAILNWTEPTFRDGIWGDVIAMHFKLNRATIAAQIKAWATKDSRMRSWLPAFNQVSGTAALQPYRGGAGGQTVGAGVNAATRDLVKEFEEAMDKVEEWRDDAFFKRVLNRF